MTVMATGDMGGNGGGRNGPWMSVSVAVRRCHLRESDHGDLSAEISLMRDLCRS